jgi:hypothetical protein
VVIVSTRHQSARAPVIELRRGEAVVHASPSRIAALRARFERNHCVLLPRLIETNLFDGLVRRVERAEFEERVHEGIAENLELCMQPNAVGGILHVLLNSPSLFALLEHVTGCGPIGHYTGRIYRVVPGHGHRDAWHDDLGGHRVLALSLNLSRARFVGGQLQIRERASNRVVHEEVNTGFGDALVFRLDPGLEHRLTEVTGARSKTALAGWFRSGADARALLPGGSGRDGDSMGQSPVAERHSRSGEPR